MKIFDTSLPGVKLLEPQVFEDARGFFLESFNQSRFDAAIGHLVTFVQDNHSHSMRGVLRGMHYQVRRPQGKLVRVIRGEVFDVVIDLRASSPTFGQWEGHVLSAENKRQLWVPEGFAHGFLTVSENAEMLYKTTDYWAPELERTIRWNDARIGINWQMAQVPLLSAKDAAGGNFVDAEFF